MEYSPLEKFLETAADLIMEAYRQEFSRYPDELEREALKDLLRRHFSGSH